MAKISTMTPEQAALLPQFRDDWLAVGLSTARVDRAASTAAVKRLYAAAGEAEPLVLHFDSPAQCLAALAVIKKSGHKLEDNLEDSLAHDLWTNHIANLGNNLWKDLVLNLEAIFQLYLQTNLQDNLEESLGDNLQASFQGSLYHNLQINLEANLGDNLWKDLMANLEAILQLYLQTNLQANLKESFWADLQATTVYQDTTFWGGQDAYWLAFSEFAGILGVPYDKAEHLRAYIDYAKTSGWMYAYKGLALVSDRPDALHKDAEGRLHCETGPALTYPDGYCLYAWHGTNIPARWITDKASLTAQEALAQENTTLRAIAMQIVGWPGMMDQLDARIIASHPKGPIGGDLLAVRKDKIIAEMPGEMRFLRAECPSNGTICFRVPDHIATPQEAQAWKSGLRPDDYEVDINRT